jgi:hypothetical protein
MTRGVRVVFSEDQSKFIKNSVLSGSTIKQLKESMGISRKYISKYCRDNNIHYNLERWTNKEDEIIKNTLSLTSQEVYEKFLPYRSAKMVLERRRKLDLHERHEKIWEQMDLNNLIEYFPHISMEKLYKLLPNYTKGEIIYMARKLGLCKSEKRNQERYDENNQKTWSYKRKLEIENIIVSLINKHHGNIHLAIEESRLLDDMYFYTKRKIYNFLVINNYINPKKWYLYLDIYCPKNTKLNWKQSLELYVTNFNEKTFNFTFSKATTIKLFKYWAKINNFDLSKEHLLSIKEFKTIFLNAKLEVSIRKHFYYTYQFIAYLLKDKNLKPYHLSIQVPDKYWNSDINVFEMMDDGVNKLINDKLIKSLQDILYLPQNIIEEYFVCSALHGKKIILIKYLQSKNIEIDYKLIKYYDGIYFESKEEMYVYKFIKNLGYSIEKVSRKDKYFNSKYNETYVPDFYLYLNNKKYILEYFGLFSNRYKRNYVAQYRIKTNNKIEYFFNNFDFIPIFPDDIRHKCIGLIEKLEERRKYQCDN